MEAQSLCNAATALEYVAMQRKKGIFTPIQNEIITAVHSALRRHHCLGIIEQHYQCGDDC